MASHVRSILVDLLNGWTASFAACRSTSACPRHTTGHAAGHTTRHTATLVQVGDDWHADFLEFLLVMLKLVFLGSLQEMNNTINMPSHTEYN